MSDMYPKSSAHLNSNLLGIWKTIKIWIWMLNREYYSDLFNILKSICHLICILQILQQSDFCLSNLVLIFQQSGFCLRWHKGSKHILGYLIQILSQSDLRVMCKKQPLGPWRQGLPRFHYAEFTWKANFLRIKKKLLEDKFPGIPIKISEYP